MVPAKQKIKQPIKYSVYLSKYQLNLFLFFSLICFKHFRCAFAMQLCGERKSLSSLFCCLLQWQMKHSIRAARTKKELGPFLFFCRLRRFICDAFSCKSASYSCYPLSLLSRRIAEKSSDIHSTPLHSTSLRFVPFVRWLEIRGTHWRPCDYHYNYFRLSHSFARHCVSSTHHSTTPPLHWIHASELILFENDIVRMLPLCVCTKQMMKLTKR